MTKDYNEAGKATARIDIRVPEALKEELKAEAKKRKISITELLLESYRENKEKDFGFN
jgi:predicted HicB family RNase H-like nuclease